MKKYLSIVCASSLICVSFASAQVSTFADGIVVGDTSLSSGLLVDVAGKVGAVELCHSSGALCSSISSIYTAVTGGSGISGSGTANYVPLFTAGTTIGNSALRQSTDANIGIGVAGMLDADTDASKLRVNGNIKMGQYLYLSGHQIYSNNDYGVFLDSNSSTVTSLELRDLENTRYGILYGSGNGDNFGLLDSDGDWVVNSVKGSHVELRDNDEATFSAGIGGVSGDYGTVESKGSGKGGWQGYSINGRTNFMHDGVTATGLYNDVDNEWILYADHNAATYLYHNGASKLYTRSDGAQTTGTHYAADFLYSSDVRLKENIIPVSGLDIVLNLKGVSFDWKETGLRGVGFIAQEVEQVAPDLVDTDKESGYKSVRYGSMTAHLVEAVKEQQQQIEEQQEQIDMLMKIVEDM